MGGGGKGGRGLKRLGEAKNGATVIDFISCEIVIFPFSLCHRASCMMMMIQGDMCSLPDVFDTS